MMIYHVDANKPSSYYSRARIYRVYTVFFLPAEDDVGVIEPGHEPGVVGAEPVELVVPGTEVPLANFPR